MAGRACEAARQVAPVLICASEAERTNRHARSGGERARSARSRHRRGSGAGGARRAHGAVRRSGQAGAVRVGAGSARQGQRRAFRTKVTGDAVDAATLPSGSLPRGVCARRASNARCGWCRRDLHRKTRLVDTLRLAVTEHDREIPARWHRCVDAGCERQLRRRRLRTHVIARQ